MAARICDDCHSQAGHAVVTEVRDLKAADYAHLGRACRADGLTYWRVADLKVARKAARARSDAEHRAEVEEREQAIREAATRRQAQLEAAIGELSADEAEQFHAARERFGNCHWSIANIARALARLRAASSITVGDLRAIIEQLRAFDAIKASTRARAIVIGTPASLDAIEAGLIEYCLKDTAWIDELVGGTKTLDWFIGELRRPADARRTPCGRPFACTNMPSAWCDLVRTLGLFHADTARGRCVRCCSGCSHPHHYGFTPWLRPSE